MRAVHAIKREMIFVRKSVWPLREVVTSLQRSESALIRESNAAYFRDLHDHILQVTDGVDTFRDLLNGMLDSYYSTITTRTNSVVKVLTLFSAIFMPLTFITGIFGMNFQQFSRAGMALRLPGFADPDGGRHDHHGRHFQVEEMALG